jgi:hypothetical protein
MRWAKAAAPQAGSPLVERNKPGRVVWWEQYRRGGSYAQITQTYQGAEFGKHAFRDLGERSVLRLGGVELCCYSPYASRQPVIAAYFTSAEKASSSVFFRCFGERGNTRVTTS